MKNSNEFYIDMTKLGEMLLQLCQGLSVALIVGIIVLMTTAK